MGVCERGGFIFSLRTLSLSLLRYRSVDFALTETHKKRAIEKRVTLAFIYPLFRIFSTAFWQKYILLLLLLRPTKLF